jgi:hypothetical protein
MVKKIRYCLNLLHIFLTNYDIFEDKEDFVYLFAKLKLSNTNNIIFDSNKQKITAKEIRKAFT